MLTSLGRLHAYNQQWETPRILVFYHYGIPSSGQLSPDGRWFAVIEGESRRESQVTAYVTDAIHIYSTFNDEEYIVEWETVFFAINRISGHRLIWLDNEHFLYSMGDSDDEEWFVINPFSQSITTWEGNFNPTQFNLDVSPDNEKALYNYWGDLSWTLNNGQQEIEVPVWYGIVWHPDSTAFAAYTVEAEISQPDQFVIFDLEGNVTDTLLEAVAETTVNLNIGNGWSHNGDYLVFGTDRLYIANIQERQVIDTCIAIDRNMTVAWSPDSQQFVLLDSFRNDSEIQIVDLQNWQRYVVGYHDGDVIGWREGD